MHNKPPNLVPIAVRLSAFPRKVGVGQKEMSLVAARISFTENPLIVSLHPRMAPTAFPSVRTALPGRWRRLPNYESKNKQLRSDFAVLRILVMGPTITRYVQASTDHSVHQNLPDDDAQRKRAWQESAFVSCIGICSISTALIKLPSDLIRAFPSLYRSVRGGW